MSSMLTSQGFILATAVAFSAGSVILFDLFRQNLFPPNQKQALKSCLSSGRERREKGSKKIKKRVKFAEDVKDSKGNGELYRRSRRRNSVEIRKMPANRAALYSGILRDRVQRMEYAY